ncbi:hypothetical protein E4U41_003913 [Claviceps citrina]|nr:hypothetical protein E4U41_003913 [Claviceps citrina]
MAIAAVGQICSTASMTANLEQCVRLVAEAAAGGAKAAPHPFPLETRRDVHDALLHHARERTRKRKRQGLERELTARYGQVLFLPEASDYIAPTAAEALRLAQPQSTSPFVNGLREAAKSHAVGIHVGVHQPLTGQQQPPTGKRLLNRALYITPDGDVQDSASYDKLHVFDYGSLRESTTVEPGAALTAPFDTPVGRIGSLICFDLRFAEPAVSLAQPGEKSRWRGRPAQILSYPSAFTVRTGRAHWETLLRARAIETQSWVVASAQVGWHNGQRASYGRSLVVDPWGEVRLRLGSVGEGEGEGRGREDDDGDADGAAEDDGRTTTARGEIGFVDLDLELVERVRREMPLLRRRDVYREV